MPASQLEFLRGKIKSVTCKYFVTYEECVFYPTPNLNVVIGPNGTGKSTLVAAIVIGLGGNPKLLSRATSIQDYVKNGSEQSTVIVEIYADERGKTVFFKRVFNINGKSEFWINEENVSIKKYLQTISNYNIQINNLCQFLPQDRVQDFAKMNSQEILNSTISSVCNEDINNKFMELKELRKKQLTSKKHLPSNIQKLKESVSRNEELKPILDKVNAKQQLLKNLQICKAKKAWIEIGEFEKKIEGITKDLESANMLVNRHEKQYKDVMQKQSGIIAKTNAFNNDINKHATQNSTILAKFENTTEAIDRTEGKISTAKHEFESKKRDTGERSGELQNETRILEALLQDIKNAAGQIGENEISGTNVDKLNQLKVEISALISKRSNINKKLDEENDAIMPTKNRIDRLENSREQKLQLLKNSYPDAYKAVRWMRENKKIFEGRTYEPRILELNIPDTTCAKYFENTIPIRDLMAFTFENKSDMSKFITHMCTEQNLMVNSHYSKPAKKCEYAPSEPITKYKQFGFHSYLIDLIEGPPAILNSLCSLFHLEKILVGTDQVNQCVDNIPTHIRTYFGGQTRYNVSISKYSREPSVMQSVIKDRHLLSSVDANELNNLKIQLNAKLRKIDVLKNERTSIEVKTRELELERTELTKDQRAIEAKLVRLKQLKEQCKQQQRKVAQLKQQIVDISKLEENFKNITKNELKKLIDLRIDKVEILKQYQTNIAKKKCSACRLQVYKQENESLTREASDATDNLGEAKKQRNTISRIVDDARKDLSLKEKEAKELTNGFAPTNSEFPYKKQFSKLPNNMDELRDSINEINGRLDCLADADQDVVNEYERRCSEIERLKQLIEETRNQDKQLEDDIKNIYSQWFSEISRIIHDLNKYFSCFMKSMGYSGEIILAKKEDYDFDSYGIQIMVQYRNNLALLPLDRHIQSGGERAVAIAVYSLSLQHLTKVPFRCVDEINQGMDPINERKIFEMLVDETSKDGRSQYFFITPKLLPNLKHSAKMSVHIVFNGVLVKPKNAFYFHID